MEIRNDIVKAVDEKKDLIWFYNYLQDYKKKDGSQKHAYEILQEIRLQFKDPEEEDLILEILDIWNQLHLNI